MTAERPHSHKEYWSEIQRHLEDVLPEISARMAKKFADFDSSSEPNSNINQLGLRNGAEIVRDYMAANEWGVAVEHLCYMIRESVLVLSDETYLAVKAMCNMTQNDSQIMDVVNPKS